MKTFFALLHKDEGSAYGISFPDVPGCFSAADRLEDVLPNACEALELWFEDAEEIEPRPMDEVARAVAADLREGASLLAVPRFNTGSRAVRVNITLDKAMLDAIDSAAAARRLTRSAFLAEAARNEIVGGH